MSVDLASPTTIVRAGGVARTGAAAALIGSAVVHATVVSDHYREWALAGLFFLALQVAETLLGLAALLAWGRRVAAAVVACSLATLGVWALSRTVGLPFGPPVIRLPEAIGAADLACVLLEVVTLVLVLPCALGLSAGQLLHRERNRQDFSSHRKLAVAAMTAVIVAVTVWGVTPALQGDSHQHNAAEAHH